MEKLSDVDRMWLSILLDSKALNEMSKEKASELLFAGTLPKHLIELYLDQRTLRTVFPQYTMTEFLEQARDDLRAWEKDWNGEKSNDWHREKHGWTEWWTSFFGYFNWEER